jgi:MerR family transcriptional regulator, copper efflux regulator
VYYLLMGQVAGQQTLTIGKLAGLAGVGVETIRFYEREKLIAEPPRRESGYREYPPDTVARIQFIKHGKELGFTLAEIRELLALRVASGTTAREIKARAKAKIVDVEQKIASLQRIRGALVAVTESCHGKGPISECPIVDALEHGAPEPACNAQKPSKEKY